MSPFSPCGWGGIYWKGGFCYWTGSRAPGTWSFALVAAVAFYFNFRPQNEGKKCPRRQQQRQIYATLTAKSFQNAFCLRQRASSGWFWVVECHWGGVIKGGGGAFSWWGDPKNEAQFLRVVEPESMTKFLAHLVHSPHTHSEKGVLKWGVWAGWQKQRH